MGMMSIFNERELAAILWLLALILLTIYVPKLAEVRAAALNLTRSALQPKLLLLFALIFLFTALSVLALQRLGLWDSSQAKNTIIWAFIGGTQLVVRSLSLPSLNSSYFAEALKEHFKLLVLIEYLVGMYTFPLIVEIALVPVLVLLVSLDETFKVRNEKSRGSQLISALLVAYGLLLLGYSIWHVFESPKAISLQTGLFDLLTPILLTCSFIPLVFSIYFFSKYEIVFGVVDNLIVDPKVSKYAKSRALLTYGCNFKLLDRWKTYLAASDRNEKSDIEKLFQSVSDYSSIEADETDIPLSEGWAPRRSMQILAKFGLETRQIVPHGNGKWSASSSMVKLNTAMITNYIAYYIEGEARATKKLRVVAYMNSLDSEDESKESFFFMANELCKGATTQEMSEHAKGAIDKNIEYSEKFEELTISLNRRSQAVSGRYEISFTILAPGCDWGWY